MLRGNIGEQGQGNSATGYGEQFQRTVLCKMISDFVYFKGMTAPEAMMRARITDAIAPA